MIIHARIDLAGVDLEKFDAYEAAVIPLLDRYGIIMAERLRAEDGSCEVHVLDVPDMDAMERFRSDEDRARVQHLWDESGATGIITHMQRID
ncbi:hypothetical protein [Altererythrobacter lutimaris]|uniref:DUF1330 domain-containing protein n=1 Tax=Altererythrobacter lutimaris TaxID=2743979 RepID=A0A850HAW9_9SPHN|nr:hypothetical protein [Altererythrobacter lutimaris]NVE94046.1 hypothetical protein [Altererythrobacter lutimaris]